MFRRSRSEEIANNYKQYFFYKIISYIYMKLNSILWKAGVTKKKPFF